VRWLALLLVALPLPLSACGGVSINAVAKAATNASASGSEHIAITGTITAAGQGVNMKGDGDFQTDPKLGAMHFDMSVAGKHIVMDEVMQAETVYMKSPLFSSQLPAGKQWMSVDLQKAGAKLGVNLSQYMQQDPTDILAALKQVGSVDKVGSETVDGIDATHYRATIDLAKAPNSQSLQQVTGLKSLPVDVWVDGNSQVRRMVMKYTTTASGQKISTNLRTDLSHYGEQVNVQVPSASDTVDMTKLGG
jgi:hypothetical protein